jgi:hypothetical protein
MAHVNTSGQHVPLFLTGEGSVGWGRDITHYPMEEGTFVGDLFPSPPVGKYCTGRGYGANTVAGRIGGNQSGTPYTAMVSSSGDSRCDHLCQVSSDLSGYYNCATAGHPITVWRSLIKAPTFDFETGTDGFTAPASSTTSATIWSGADNCVTPATNCHKLGVDVTATGAGTQVVTLPAPAAVIPGQAMVVFVKNISGTNWTYAQAFVQDGPGKGYRWTSSGYTRSELGVNAYNSIVVPVPADFSASGGTIGVAFNMTGAGTARFFVDTVSFGS